VEESRRKHQNVKKIGDEKNEDERRNAERE